MECDEFEFLVLSMSSEPDSFSLHPFELPNATLTCAFCFAPILDSPVLPDHPIYSALDQVYPDLLRMKEE